MQRMFAIKLSGFQHHQLNLYALLKKVFE